MQSSDKTVFVKITPEKGQVIINYSVRILFNEKAHGYSCFLPGFNIYFSASTTDILEKKARILSRFYFDHFMEHTEKQGLKKLVLDLNRKGFKANNNIDTVHKLINNKIIPAKFKAPDFVIPQDFKSASSINQNAQFAMA